MIAFIDNNNIFITADETIIPQGAITLKVPEGTTPFDLVADNGILRFKNDEEKLTDQKEKEKQEALQKLAETDTQMARVVEDVINILITKNIIKQDDLPTEVIEKINYRKELRSKINENIK